MNYKEVVCNAMQWLGQPYVYGAKGEILTQNIIDVLAKNNKKTFTKTYIEKAKKFIGQRCIDCSGLVCEAMNIGDLGSYHLYEKAEKDGFICKVSETPVGSVLYKKGHVAIKINDTYCIEAKGIGYGVIVSKISSTKWTNGLVFHKITNYFVDGVDKNNIKVIQMALNKFLKKEGGSRVTPLIIDGVYGPKTNSAINVFCEFHKVNECKLMETLEDYN